MDTDPDILPEPGAEQQAHSRKLRALIAEEIRSQGGSIPFWRYMEMALYAPGLGYYTAGLRKFGPDGDFTTAPELSSLFSRCLARQVAEVLQDLDGGDVLEFGAGSGVMAADILLELERLGSLPGHYSIIELSPVLQQRQRETLQQRAGHLLQRVSWLNRLPEAGFCGVMLANELLDAMPVDRFRWQGGEVQSANVVSSDEGFEQVFGPADEGVTAAVSAVIEHLSEPLPDAYESELNLSLSPWLSAVGDVMSKGVLLLIDYGCSAGEYYHPQRDSGTLMCHYRHRAHPDPFILTGLQDITAWVDFTAVADAATAACWELAGYNTQAMFLLASGLESLLAETDPADQLRFLQYTSEIKQLTLPGEMGERFKVMALAKDVDQPLSGFALQDLRNRL